MTWEIEFLMSFSLKMTIYFTSVPIMQLMQNKMVNNPDI
jgi:hypothetical protein